MRIPTELDTLFDYGIVEEVVRPLMSGKEAQIYLVVSQGRLAVAKVYKDAQNRSFKHRAEYTEGRKVRNTRDQRAMDKRSRYGRAQDEAAWRSTEVDTIHRLHAAGVRVPIPYHFIDGVLLMELIADAQGNPAPRLGDLSFDADTARRIYDCLLREVMRMLCAGIVHGDLSDFNVLVGSDGPVVIDFPQSVSTSHNVGARRLLMRDVDNLHRFLSRFVPNARRTPYAEEMWDLYQQNALTPDTRLTGRHRSAPKQNTNMNGVLDLIREANQDERKRRDALGLRGGPPAASGGGRPPPAGQRDPNRKPSHHTSGGGNGQAAVVDRHPSSSQRNARPAKKPSDNRPANPPRQPGVEVIVRRAR